MSRFVVLYVHIFLRTVRKKSFPPEDLDSPQQLIFALLSLFGLVAYDDKNNAVKKSQVTFINKAVLSAVKNYEQSNNRNRKQL